MTPTRFERVHLTILEITTLSGQKNCHIVLESSALDQLGQSVLFVELKTLLFYYIKYYCLYWLGELDIEMYIYVM